MILQQPRVLTLCNAGGEGYPYVLLKGKWFRKYGFQPGNLIKVSHIAQGAMIITIDSREYKLDPYREKMREIIEFSEEVLRKGAA